MKDWLKVLALFALAFAPVALVRLLPEVRPAAGIGWRVSK